MEIAIGSKSENGGYRLNVALILENSEGHVLIGERRDVAGSWQFPQGGVQEGESFEEALHREVKEEIQLSPQCYCICKFKGPYRYQFPKVFEKLDSIGQEQHYFHATLIEEESSLKMNDTSDEFRALRWIAPTEFKLQWLHPMKRSVYAQVFQDFFNLTL